MDHWKAAIGIPAASVAAVLNSQGIKQKSYQLLYSAFPLRNVVSLATNDEMRKYFCAIRNLHCDLFSTVFHRQEEGSGTLKPSQPSAAAPDSKSQNWHM